MNENENLPIHQNGVPHFDAADPRAGFGPAPEMAGDPLSHAPSGPDWERCFAALRRYRWWIAVATVVGTALGVAVARQVRPEYLAEAMLWVDWSRRDRAGPAPIESGELLRSYNWVDLVKSYAVLEPAVRELRLYVRPAEAEDAPLFASFRVEGDFQPGRYELRVDRTGESFALRLGDSVVVQRGGVGEPVGHALGLRWTPPAGTLTPGRKVEFEVLRLRDAARELGEGIRPQMLEDGNFLRLELRGSDPGSAAAVLNTIAQRTVAIARELKGAKAEELERLLGDQLRVAEGKLLAAEGDLEAFRQRTITLPVARDAGEAGTDPLSRKYLELRLERDQLGRDRDAIQRALVGARASGAPVELLEAIPAARGSTELQAALQDLTDKRAERRALGRRYTDEHPAVRRLDQQIEALEQGTVPALARRVADQLAERVELLDEELRSAAAELRLLPEWATEEARLRRRVEGAEELFTALQARYDEARLAAASTVPDVRILDPAEAPQLPVSDERRRILLLAFLGSLGLAVGGSLLVDRIDPRLRYPQQVSYGMGLPILGMVPRLKARMGRYAPDDATQGVEAFRSIRLNLSYAFGAAGPITVTITSPGPGDGKSFVALNLALAYAEIGYRTLLIDGDTRRGKLHRPLSLSRKPGLTDYLAGEATLEAVIRPTGHRSLDLIGGGTRRQHAPELLTGRRMRDLLARARSHYEAIIVDSPPLGAGADPLILAGFTGHLLFVLRAGATNRAAAAAHLEPIRAFPVRLLGAVLNDVPATGLYRYYRYLPGYAAQEEEGTEHSAQRLLPT